jgi:tetratricopeptide (TPR) repeat protein
MSEGPISPETRQKIRELMGRATLSRVRGQHSQALQLAQEALILSERNYETHEFIGDVLMDLGRGADAFNSFRRARELNPTRVELEDKLARASLSRAAVRDSMAQMQAVLEGRVPREKEHNPTLAALASLLLPGLGQIYNGEFPKGLGLVGAFLLLATLAMLSVLRQVAARGYGTQDYVQLLAGAAVWLIPLGALYVYAVVDAILQARKTESSRPKMV